MNRQSTGRSTHRLPSKRLSAPGPAPSPLVTWGARLTLILPAIALLWLLYVLLAPLDTNPTDTATQTIGITGIEKISIPDTPDIEQRQDRLASLRRDNPFAADRAFWRLEEIRAAQSTEQTEPQPEPEPVRQTIASTNEPGEIPITPLDRLSTDTTDALDNLNLRAIRSRSDAVLIAMLSFNKGPLAGPLHEYAEGVSFEDPNHKDAEWTIFRIDAALNRILLRRNTDIIAIDLFPRHAALASANEPTADDSPAVGTDIEHQSLLDAMGQLRESGEVSEDELDHLARLLGDTSSTDAQPPEADADHDSNPAEGMKEVLKMMRNADQNKRKRESNKKKNDPESPDT